VESLLPHLASSSAAHLIPAVNPAIIAALNSGTATISTVTAAQPSAALAYLTSVTNPAVVNTLAQKSVPSYYTPPPVSKPASIDDDVPYLPSDNSPPRNN